MHFPSKKDFWLFLIFWGTIVICTIPIFIERDLVFTLIMLPIDIVLIWFWFTTGYILERETLIIKFGPFKNKVSIMEISKIKGTKNPLSAPALSMDRLEITYGRFNFALVSPKEKQLFITKLLEINPHIEVEPSLLEK